MGRKPQSVANSSDGGRVDTRVGLTKVRIERFEFVQDAFRLVYCLWRHALEGPAHVEPSNNNY